MEQANYDFQLDKVKYMKNFSRRSFLILLALTLLGCNIQAQSQTPHAKMTGAPEIATATPSAKATGLPPPNELIVLENLDLDSAPINAIPNLWNRIDKDKITIYPNNWLIDYAYDKDGGVWIVGTFGVIHTEPNGKQTWYSMKNGLPSNFFRTIAISPTGEIWIGGADNALLRFDGAGWVDEGLKLPNPLDSFSDWLCYSKDIVGIDFDQDGAAWVMNAGVELYVQAHGGWVNFPFPKNILPMAGGGACPEGIRVKSENDITIKRHGCCESPPVAYHYDGKIWVANSDFAVVDKLLQARHTPKPNTIAVIQTSLSSDGIWPFAGIQGALLPKGMPLSSKYNQISMMTDQNGVIWVMGSYDLYNNATGAFQPYAGNYAEHASEGKNNALLNFGNVVFYRQEGKRPAPLAWTLNNTGIEPRYDPLYPGVDQENRVWFYHPQKGLAMLDDGNLKILATNPELGIAEIGRVLPLQDGRVLVGSAGVLWLFDGNGWQKLALPGQSELFSFLGEDRQGIIYAAGNTGVYKIDIQHQRFSPSIFVREGIKPVVVPSGDEPKGCTFQHRHYNSFSNCSWFWEDASLEAHYDLKLFSLQDDGSIYYVNNKIVAKFENGIWKSFLFDTIEIEAATIDKDKAIWLYTNKNGLLRLAPDIFTAYQQMPLPGKPGPATITPSPH